MRPVPMKPIVGFVILYSSDGRVGSSALGITRPRLLRKSPRLSDSLSSRGFGRHAAEGRSRIFLTRKKETNENERKPSVRKRPSGPQGSAGRGLRQQVDRRRRRLHAHDGGVVDRVLLGRAMDAAGPGS